MNPREVISGLWRVALEATRGDRLLDMHANIADGYWTCNAANISRSVKLPAQGGRIFVVGAGKAAAALARGLENSLGERIHDGIVIVKQGHSVPLRRIRVFEAAHPVPDAAGELATGQVLELLDGLTNKDLLFVLLTGGASALLVAPVPGITLAGKAAVHASLVRSGASIQEINVVRKHLSLVKGGQLVRHAGGAAVVTLLISDVLGDDPATIASGPTVADPSTFQDALAILERHKLSTELPPQALSYLRRGVAGAEPETPKSLSGMHQTPWVLASNRLALATLHAAGRAQGFEVHVLQEALKGDTHQAARDFAVRFRDRVVRRNGAAPLMVLAGGETTIKVRGAGSGGRCQEFALVAAQCMADQPRFTILAAGTDGSDGPTDAAGAFVDETTLTRATALGLDPEVFLADNNCYEFFRYLGDLFTTGPTGTNVMDLVVAVSPPES